MTVLQELIEWTRTPAKPDSPISIMDKMEQLLEKEELQIIEAFRSGHTHDPESEMLSKDAQNYYESIKH